MNKSALIIKTPENCCKCILNNSDFCIATKNCTLKFTSHRPDWCPLKEVPERYDDMPCDDSSLYHMSVGWNNCVDELLGY